LGTTALQDRHSIISTVSRLLETWEQIRKTNIIFWLVINERRGYLRKLQQNAFHRIREYDVGYSGSIQIVSFRD